MRLSEKKQLEVIALKKWSGQLKNRHMWNCDCGECLLISVLVCIIQFAPTNQ